MSWDAPRAPRSLDEWADAVARAEANLATLTEARRRSRDLGENPWPYRLQQIPGASDRLQRLLNDTYCGSENIIFTEDAKRAALATAREREATRWREWRERVDGTF